MTVGVVVAVNVTLWNWGMVEADAVTAVVVGAVTSAVTAGEVDGL